MNDSSKRRRSVDIGAILQAVVGAVVFVVAVGVVVINQRTVGWANLAWMLGGLAALLFLLWTYNRRHR